MSGGFQTSVNTQPAPAVAGDWASTNPRFFYDAGPGGLVAGLGGITIARFCWALPAPTDPNSAPQQVVNFGTGGSVAGIVHREQQGLITTYLSDAGMVIPAGFPVTVCTGGDIWVKNDGSTTALLNQKAYASLATGQVSFGATGNPSTASGSLSTIAAQTASVTGSVNGNVLNATVVSGTIYAGSVISGTVGGSGIATGTTIVSQLTGTIGGVGTYLLSPGEQTVGSGSLSLTYGLVTVGGTVSGTFGAGAVLGGTGVAAGSTITALGTGTGGAGTYITQTQAMSVSNVTATINVETKWFATSSGLAGELIKISSHSLG